MKKRWAMVWTRGVKIELGFFFEKNGLISQNSISRERLIVRSSLTPHFNRNRHFPILVTYNVYPSDQQKWLKLKVT